MVVWVREGGRAGGRIRATGLGRPTDDEGYDEEGRGLEWVAEGVGMIPPNCEAGTPRGKHHECMFMLVFMLLFMFMFVFMLVFMLVLVFMFMFMFMFMSAFMLVCS